MKNSADYVKKKEQLFRICSKFFSGRKIIIFESIPDLTDNTKAVFDEMLRRGVNRKYKLVWLLYDENEICYPKYKNVAYIKNTDRVKRNFYLITAKAKICCNHFLESYSENQISFFLSHGSPIKNTSGYYKFPSGLSYAFEAAEEANRLNEGMSSPPTEKVVCGYPRNDVFSRSPIDLKKYFGDYKKIIIWYPTFRQNKQCEGLAGGNALPIIHDNESAEKLNNIAKRENVLIVLKPHFAQDLSYLDIKKLSNIRFIDDLFLKKNEITSYEMLGGSDALITDYSSVYYDYLLCDKPIAAVWEDIEEYKKNPGLIENYEYYMQGAEKVYHLEEMIAFVQNVATGKDTLKEERNQMKLLMNYSDDGKNAERVVNFILDKIE